MILTYPSNHIQAQLSSEDGSSVNIAGGGQVIAGATTGSHIAIDADDIQRKSGTSYSTLYLNYYGGNVDLLGGGNTTGDLSVDGSGLRYDNSSNNVGIGVSTPLERLHINGGTTTDIRLDATASKYLRFYEGTAQKMYVGHTGTHGYVMNQETGGNLYLGTLNFIRATFTSAGDLGIGTVSPTAKVEISHNSSTADAHLELYEAQNDYARIKFRSLNSGSRYWDLAARSHTTTGTSNRFNLFFYDGTVGNDFFSIDPILDNILIDGDVRPFAASLQYDIGNNTSTEYWDDVNGDDFINHSDARLKKNITTLSPVLNSVLQLRPVNYEYKEEYNKDGRFRTGFVAQEVQALFPSVIVDEDVDVDEQTGELIRIQSDYLGMNYIEMIPILTKAIQEQQQLITDLQQQVSDLQSQLND